MVAAPLSHTWEKRGSEASRSQPVLRGPLDLAGRQGCARLGHFYLPPACSLDNQEHIRLTLHSGVWAADVGPGSVSDLARKDPLLEGGESSNPPCS